VSASSSLSRIKKNGLLVRGASRHCVAVRSSPPTHALQTEPQLVALHGSTPPPRPPPPKTLAPQLYSPPHPTPKP
jgi:hypothetical protein